MWAALRVGVLSYVGLCLLLFFRQSRYVYFPARDVTLTPAAANLRYEEVTLRTSDGETLQAWFVPAQGSTTTLLYCHGNAGNIGDRVPALALFHELGLTVFMFEYRGYGHSTGTPTEAGTYRDAQAAWDYLTQIRKLAPGHIVVMGRSLGGAVAAWLAAQQTPGALILEATFTSLPDMAQQLYWYLPARWFCRLRYDTLSRMSAVRCPVLVAHSPDDEMIPCDQARRLFAAAPAPKEFLELRGSHNADYDETGPAYGAGIGGFLARQGLGRGAPKKVIDSLDFR